MRLALVVLAALGGLVAALPASAVTPPGVPAVIAHRGASADRPEHTLGAYLLAIEQGADWIEPDLVITKDGVLIARHENEIGQTTDVAERPEFADRRTTRRIDGVEVTGWFTEDFTLEELRTLRARERLPQLRPGNMAWNDQEPIPTFREILALAQSESQRRGRTIGVYPETKHPSYFQSIGLALEERLLADLRAFGHEDETAPILIQSFEISNLVWLAHRTRVRLVQLIAAEGAPFDQQRLGSGHDYAAMLTPEGLAAIRRYAWGIGPQKELVLPRDAQGRLGPATDLVARARSAGLAVHVWTLRPENFFLPVELRIGEDPRGRGDGAAEARAFLDAGVDGYFTDSVEAGVAGRQLWQQQPR